MYRKAYNLLLNRAEGTYKLNLNQSESDWFRLVLVSFGSSHAHTPNTHNANTQHTRTHAHQTVLERSGWQKTDVVLEPLTNVRQGWFWF